MPLSNRFLSLLGLCQRAGRLVSGELSCENAVKGKKAKLIIIAEDASDNTKKKFKNAAVTYKADIICSGNKYEIGKAIGKDMRSSVAVTDEGFARRMIELFNQERV